MRSFLVVAFYSYRATFEWLTPGAYLAAKVLFPLLQMAFFSLLGSYAGSQPASFYVLGNAILVGYRPMLPIAAGISSERWQGTLPYLVAAPANRAATFFARALVHVLDGFTSIGIALIFAIVVFRVDLSAANLPGLFVAMCVATYCAATMGLLLGPAAYVFLESSFLANTALFALILLSGANVPVSELPAPLGAISTILPMTRSIAAARAFADGALWNPTLMLLVGDVLLGSLWAVAGLGLFASVERIALRRGTLEGL